MSAVVGTLPRINTPGSRTGGKPRSGVRAGSRPADAARGFYRAINQDEATRLMKVARHYADAHRRKGLSPLTPSTLKVLETMLFKAMDWTTGKLDWSYLQIAERSGRAVDTVWRAILQLEAGGWLERMRRCEPNLDAGPGDAPFRQITNAYRLQLPAQVKRWWQDLGIRRGRKAPVSADLEHDQAVRAGERSLMEPQNHQMMGERAIESGARERERRRAQSQRAVGGSSREAQQNGRPNPDTALSGDPGALEREAKAKIAAQFRALADERERSTFADSDNQ